VAELRGDGSSNTGWNFMWRRRLFVWEVNLLNSLLAKLHDVVLSHGEDVRVWKLEENGEFSVSSLYKKLEVFSAHDDDTGEEERRVFVQLWKSPAPSKVVALSWKALLNRIPTIVNLHRRHAIPLTANLHSVL